MSNFIQCIWQSKFVNNTNLILRCLYRIPLIMTYPLSSCSENHLHFTSNDPLWSISYIVLQACNALLNEIETFIKQTIHNLETDLASSRTVYIILGCIKPITYVPKVWNVILHKADIYYLYSFGYFRISKNGSLITAFQDISYFWLIFKRFGTP